MLKNWKNKINCHTEKLHTAKGYTTCASLVFFRVEGVNFIPPAQKRQIALSMLVGHILNNLVAPVMFSVAAILS